MTEGRDVEPGREARMSSGAGRPLVSGPPSTSDGFNPSVGSVEDMPAMIKRMDTIDQRRQEQINRQKEVIDRLLMENASLKSENAGLRSRVSSMERRQDRGRW